MPRTTSIDRHLHATSAMAAACLVLAPAGDAAVISLTGFTASPSAVTTEHVALDFSTTPSYTVTAGYFPSGVYEFALTYEALLAEDAFLTANGTSPYTLYFATAGFVDQLAYGTTIDGTLTWTTGTFSVMTSAIFRCGASNSSTLRT